MTCTDFPHPAPTTARSDDSILFAALELSRKSWLVATSAPGEEKVSKRTVSAGDGRALLDLLAGLREKAERRIGKPVKVVVIQEAGLDGFWLHRLLEANGIESHVVDPASIAVDRRKRRRKTDAIDVDALLRTLMAWARRAPGLFDGPAAEPGRGGAPASVAGTRGAGEGADPELQPHQRPPRGSGDRRLRAAAAGPPGTS